MIANVYRALLVAEFQAAAQYRVQSVLWLLFAVVRPVVFLAAWSAVAEAQGGAVGDMSRADFAAYYVALTLVGQLTMAWVAETFERDIRQGFLSPKLLRPLHPLHYSVAENVVFKVTTLPALLPALVLIGWTFGAEFHSQWWHLALFLPSVLLAAALRFVFNWLLASLAFWTTRVHSITHLFDRFVFILGGQVAPLTQLGAFAPIAYALPFGYMLWAPAEIARGGPTLDQALAMVGMQVLWLVVASIAYVVVWRVGLRQYSAVGA